MESGRWSIRSPEGPRAGVARTKEQCSHPSLDVERCVSCGRHMNYDVYFNVCPHCGFTYRIHISGPELGGPEDQGLYPLIYFTSLAVPLAGLVIGALYLGKGGRDDKRVGRDCLALGATNCLALIAMAYTLTSWIWP